MRNSALSRVIRLLQIAHRANENPQYLQEMEQVSEKSFSRREMLKLTGGLTAGLTAALPFSLLVADAKESQGSAKLISGPATPLKSTLQGSIDPILILGAGVSGLVAAYRLHKKGVPCVIYEASERVGGRMFTLANFNSEGMFCELGGEAVDSDHTALMSLCAELGVGIQDTTAEDQGLEQGLYYADGRLIPTAEMIAAFQPLAGQIAKDLREIWGLSSPRGISYKDKSNPGLVKYDRMSLSQYLYGKKDVEKWVLDLISSLYVCEFGLDTEEQSALNFLSMIAIGGPFTMNLLGVSDEKFRIQGGSSALCNALAKVLQGKVPIYMGHQLLKIQEKSGRLIFSFKKGSTIDVSAKQAICTIPFSVLRSVEGISGLDLNPDLKRCISEMGYGKVSKWSIGFKSQFWRKDKKHPSTGAILSVDEQQFVNTSRMQKGTMGILTRFLAGSKAMQISDGTLERNLQFLDLLYPGAKNEFDGKHVLMPWAQFPWSKGCYSCLKPGQYTAFNGLAAEPCLGGRLLFAGEHTSVDYGGFMNGAVETGNAAANKILLQKSESFFKPVQKTAQLSHGLFKDRF